MSYEKVTGQPPPPCPRCPNPALQWIKGEWKCTVCGYGKNCGC